MLFLIFASFLTSTLGALTASANLGSNLTVQSVANVNGVTKATIAFANGSSPSFELVDNDSFQNPQNPDKVNIVSYYTYGVNCTDAFLSPSLVDIDSFNHYAEETNSTGVVKVLDGKNYMINLTSTAYLVEIDYSLFTAHIDAILEAAIESNGTEFEITLGTVKNKQLALKISLSRDLVSLDSDSKTILTNVLDSFFIQKENYGSIPDINILNIDGAGSSANIMFAKSFDDLEYIVAADEQLYKNVAYA